MLKLQSSMKISAQADQYILSNSKMKKHNIISTRHWFLGTKLSWIEPNLLLNYRRLSELLCEDMSSIGLQVFEKLMDPRLFQSQAQGIKRCLEIWVYVQSGGARPNLYGDVPWVVGFQKKCLPYLAPCSGPLEAIRKLVARFFG